MSVIEQVSSLLTAADAGATVLADDHIKLLLQEVKKLLGTTGSSFPTLCHAIESASSREDMRTAFKNFNVFARFILEAATTPQNMVLVRRAFLTMGVSKRLTSSLESATTIREALMNYKTAALQELSIALRRKENQARRDDLQDAELFSQFLPEPVSPISSDHEPSAPVVDAGVAGFKRRGISTVAALEAIPRKSKKPALASIEQLAKDLSEGVTPKKKLLVTRERLRAGFHDPKGLLDLVGSSTNALERIKKLELLKCAGYEFKSNEQYNFPDKLNAAVLRLELGLGGHSLTDTQIFGAKVLSLPGVLSKKNISDIQNNAVEGKTT